MIGDTLEATTFWWLERVGVRRLCQVTAEEVDDTLPELLNGQVTWQQRFVCLYLPQIVTKPSCIPKISGLVNGILG